MKLGSAGRHGRTRSEAARAAEIQGVGRGLPEGTKAAIGGKNAGATKFFVIYGRQDDDIGCKIEYDR
jgi:hypothetical protein